MIRTIGKVIEVSIPKQYKNGSLLDVMDRTNIGFKVMTNNEFQTVGLYDHNADSYRMVRNAYESGENIVGIVHATGTGKSYNALQLVYDNKDKKIVFIT